MKEERRELVRIVGSGGGKSGGGDTYEADDNMFARQSAAFIDAVAEGPIKGLVYGDGSILIDETRIRDVDQSTGEVSANANVVNYSVITADGSAAQTPDPEFFSTFPTAAIVTEIGSAELLLNEAQFHTISSGTFEKQNADYIKVTISTTGMQSITKKGDNKGDIRTTNVYFNIDFRWIDSDGVARTKNKFLTGFNGKVSGKYAHTFGFNIESDKAVNGMTDWSVRITRTGGAVSSDTYEVSNAIYVDSIEASIADKLEYPYTAYVAGVIDAEQFSSVPARGYEIDGKLIQIPSNHAPVDYNGRKCLVASTTGFSVGDSVSQSAVGITSIIATGDADEGYTAEVITSANHGQTIGKAFTITIATTASQDEDFFEGTFTAESTAANKFTYVLNRPYNTTTGAYTAITSTTCTGTMTGSMFSGGIIDKIVTDTAIYLRDVAATDKIVTGSNLSNGSATESVTGVSQVMIPANYRRSPSTEKITTSEQDWDGTFYTKWCNNPAWVFYDLVTNKIYGLGNYLNETQVNKWELYQIGRYCDELVPAGVEAADLLSLHCIKDSNYTPASGEYEPRFSANLVIAGKEQAYKVLNDVTSIFRGMLYWLNGEAFIVQDSEKDPVYQFTNANVIDGQFTYEGTANKTRTNQIMVKWNNPQDYYRKRTEIVELEEDLQKDGEFIKPDSVTAFGCTSRGQARRLGKWKLLSNKLHTNTVSFSTSLNAAFLRPGDIIQISDKHKNTKSWGGRIMSSSTTTAINVDRKPTGFGDTSVESGYAVGDYRLTCSFVGYKTLLAQDQATINVNGVTTDLVRGNEITHFGSTAITTEELGKKIEDTSGNYVFTQWTPFTYTETKTVSAVSNSGKTITVSSAFGSAPTNDQVWILSRASLETGKTKEEAKLYRILQLTETDRSAIEINALEYNATKFDAVDKNEALSKDRQIFLPDSFKPVPAVTNLGYQAKIVKLGDSDGLVNRITFSWDPPRNVDDNAQYTFVRHYEVYYSTDQKKWIAAGHTTNTSIDKDGLPSATYYLKVFTVSLQGKRSEPADATLSISFQRAVGPSEGTVGNGDFTINKIGTISGGYSIDGGKVTFSPANQQHDDGNNSHSVAGQAQLDFTGLTGSDSDNNGANTGYIYMDHSANAFIAVAHDEVSDQFYTSLGGSPFAAATGTITCSPSMISTATHTPNHILGLDSTNFDGELAVDNLLKFTKSSTDYYHRVRSFTSDTEMLVDPAVNVTVVDGDNQAFSKPSFHADYQKDTIIGMVKKSSAGAYTLTKYGSSQGEGAYEIQGTNEAHTFAANTSNEISQSDYEAYTNSYTIRRDGSDWTYAASGTTAETFSLTVTAVTGFSATSDVNISGSGVVTIDDNSLDSVTSGTATIQIKDLQRNYVISNRVLSFSKAVSGSSSAGTDAIAIKLIPDKHVVAYDKDGNETTTIAFTTEVQGGSELSGTAYYEFLVDGSAPSGGAVNSTTSTWTLPDANEPAESATITVKVQLRDGGTTGTVKAVDSVGLYGVKSGTDAYTVVVTNEAHTLPTTTAGAITYTGSGTDIRVLKGSSLLEPTTGSVSTGKFKVTVASDTNIDVNASPTLVDVGSTGTNNTVRFGVASSMTADTAEIEYSIAIEGIQTVVKNQTFSKSQQGATGATGTAAYSVRLSSSKYVISYNIDGAESDSLTFTAAPQGIQGTATYKFEVDGTEKQAASTTATYAMADGDEPAAGAAKLVKVTMYDDGTEKATDSVSIYGVQDGEDAVTIIVTNEAHALPTNAAGTVTYTNSGTDIRVYKGNTALAYGTGNSQFTVAASASGITAGAASTVSTYTRRFADASGASATATITYTISVKNAVGTSTDYTKIQTFNKTVDGSDGDASKTVFYRKSGASRWTPPSSPSGDITATSIVNQWGTVFVAPDASNVVWQSIGNLPSGGSWTWGAPTIFFDKDRIVDLFEDNYSWNFGGTGVEIIGLTQNDYVNSQITLGGLGGIGSSALPTYTTGTAVPSSSPPSGSTYRRHGVTPEELYIYNGSSWTKMSTNTDTQATAAETRAHFSGSFASGDGAFSYNSSTGAFTMTGPSAAETRAHFSHSGAGSYNASTGVFTGVDTTYEADDFNITELTGFTAAAYANAELGWGDISVTVGGQYTSWSWLGSLYNPSSSTQTLTMACTHPSFGTSVITGTWERTAKEITDFTLSGSPEGTGAGASQNNGWAFADTSGGSDNDFGSDSGDHVTKTIYVRHESGKVIAITANVVNANFSVKCLTPAMLPENLQIGDKVDSPQGKTKVTDIIRKQREGYYILEDELEITNDHPILIDGEWILAEEYQGKKEYIDEPTDVIYVETENELLTVKDWTVGGKY